MDYLLKSSAIIILFYGFYKLVLQRETFFQSNRWFLLIGLLSSVLIPLIVIPVYVAQLAFLAGDFVAVQSNNTSVVQNTIDWMYYLKLIYFSGVLFFGVKFIFDLSSLGSLIISHKKEKIDHYYFIETTENTTPFSFFNYIVFNPNQFKKEELSQIITHEKVHVKQFHSIDVLLSHTMSIFFWFNPFSWLFKKEIQQNLEFIADALAQEKATCEKSYQQLLLKSSLPKNQLILTNNFYNSLIKKRIIMLHKNRSKSKNQWKYALILPLITAFVFTFNTEVIAQTETTVKINSIEFIEDSEEKNADEKTELKNFSMSVSVTKDSQKEDFKRIKKMFKKEIFKEHLGTIDVSFSGIKRNNNGEITSIEIEIRSKTTTANYSTSSNTPIKPIQITVGNNGKGISISTMGAKIPSVPNPPNSPPSSKELSQMMTITATAIDKNISLSGTSEKTLYFIDGKESSKEQLDKLNPKTIDSMSILKGKAATKEYGKKGENGVVLIVTKK